MRTQVAFTHDLGPRWSRWLIGQFGDRPTEIARAFGVSRQAATGWLDGAEPRGRHLAHALVAYPGAASTILGVMND